MPRETAAQKRSRISLLLADYDARNRELRKLETIVKGLKEQVKEIEPGTYGEWIRSEGTPREILDQAAAKKLIIQLGAEVPMVMTSAPVVVTPKAGN
jgi:hypothetical protein